MDYETQIAQALRRQQDAQGRSQFQAPQGRMVSGIYVAPNPLEYLASALRSGGAGLEAQMAGQEAQNLGQERTQGNQKALAEFLRQSQGQPADVLPEDQAGPVRPAQAPDLRGAYGALMQAPGQDLQRIGMQGITQLPQIEAQQAERQADRAFRQQEREAVAAQRMQEMQAQHDFRMQQLQDQNASRQQMMQEQQAFQREMAKIRASMAQASAQPYFTPVPTAAGVVAFNNRTGTGTPLAIDGKPVIPAAADPALQGAITGAETTARKGAESTAEARTEARKADMFLSQLKQAEDILKAGPTASGVGAAVDAAGRVIGASTPSAQRAGQLEALSGWLVANVPRMEGPQSNFDVQNYMTMAGKIGDRTTPVAERLAALQEVRRLQEKYRDVANQRIGNTPARSTQDQQALDWANSNPNDPRSAEIKRRLGAN